MQTATVPDQQHNNRIRDLQLY